MNYGSKILITAVKTAREIIKSSKKEKKEGVDTNERTIHRPSGNTNPPADRAKLEAALHIKQGATFYSPFLYEDEDTPSYADDEIHYTDATIQDNPDYTDVQEGKSEISHGERTMHYVRIKNQRSNLEYLAFFTSPEKLRAIFPTQRICKVKAIDNIRQFYRETSGIVIDTQVVITNEELKHYSIILEET